MKTIIVLLTVLIAAAALAATAPEREPTPMMAEIQAAFEAAQAEVADLRARYEIAADPVRARELRQESARVKREVRVEIMRIQLRHAQARGDSELAAKLQEIVTQMTTPPAKGIPQPRRGHE